MGAELAYMSAAELAGRVRSRDLSPVEVVDYFLARIEERNPAINAYVDVLGDEARDRAKAAEKAVTSGAELGPLHGVPLALKDLFTFKPGVRSTGGSVPFKDFIAQETTSYVADLESAGAITLGMTNSPEIGHKGTTDNYLFGPTSTPFAIGYNSGGSSGGSAAAVAAGLAPLSQGTDGGGSIRIPASCCNAYGYKASYGRIPFIIRPNAFLSSTPFIFSGPITRTVEDAALMLQVMAHHDPRDPMSLPDQGTDYVAATRKSVRGMKVAYSPDFGIYSVDERVAKVVAEALPAFKEMGATVEEVDIKIDATQQELSALWVRQMALVHLELAHSVKPLGIDLLGEHNDQLNPTFARTLEIGQAMSGWDQRAGELLRSKVYDPIQDVLDDYDVLVTPTLASPPPVNATDGDTLGPAHINGVEMERTIGWCMTYPINYTGNPAASIPAGFADGNLPIGMQIIGRRHDDETVLAISAAFERTRPWHHKYLELEASFS
jgi:Asp-tRNA(Asn)/Glu-tRNA(Gln) amidotransferase A subunit family amidase